MKIIASSLIVGMALTGCGSALAQNANPYSGAAGFLYSLGRVAAPGQPGGVPHPPAPDLDSPGSALAATPPPDGTPTSATRGAPARSHHRHARPARPRRRS